MTVTRREACWIEKVSVKGRPAFVSPSKQAAQADRTAHAKALGLEGLSHTWRNRINPGRLKKTEQVEKRVGNRNVQSQRDQLM